MSRIEEYLPNKPRIAWIKWKDPMSDDAQEEQETQDDFLEEPKDKKSYKVMMTSMGMVPIPEYSLASKTINFWTFHTNFNITNDVVAAVEKTPGVETLDVYTRYRGRVGIGMMFNPEDVRNRINASILKIIEQ